VVKSDPVAGPDVRIGERLPQNGFALAHEAHSLHNSICMKRIKHPLTTFDIVSVFVFLTTGLLLLLYGIALFGFYGFGIVYIWPAPLYLLIALSIAQKKDWGLHVSVILFYSIFFSLGYTIVNNYLACIRSVTCSHTLFIDVDATFLVSVTTLIIITLRYCMRPITIHSFLYGWISPVTILSFCWTLLVGHLIWEY
jgi:hypothetical protein